MLKKTFFKSFKLLSRVSIFLSVFFANCQAELEGLKLEKLESMQLEQLESLLLDNLESLKREQLEKEHQLQAACHKISRKLSSVSLRDCQQQNFSIKAYSHKNFPLLYKTYPPMQRQVKGKVLLIGGIHGDEYSSVSIVFKWMNILNQHHSGLYHWKFLPLLNPDGLLQRHSKRFNANKVDLNRNFPSLESPENHLLYWKNKTHSDPRRYPGEKPLTEVESLALQHIISEFKPDVIISVHAPYGIVDFDGDASPPKKLGPLNLHLLGTYPGSLGRYGSEILKIPVVTVELKLAGIMPSKTAKYPQYG